MACPQLPPGLFLSLFAQKGHDIDGWRDGPAFTVLCGDKIVNASSAGLFLNLLIDGK